MKQSRLMSLVETFGGTTLGFFVSLAIQHALVWWLDLPLSSSQNVGIILIFTIASLLRGYGWRRFCEALHIRVPMPASILAIAAERQRQIAVEGWTLEHDDVHAPGAMALAAAGYAATVHERQRIDADRFLSTLPLPMPTFWPWGMEWWKPQDNRRDLIRAGALIAAELDKMDRARRQRSRA